MKIDTEEIVGWRKLLGQPGRKTIDKEKLIDNKVRLNSENRYRGNCRLTKIIRSTWKKEFDKEKLIDNKVSLNSGKQS